MAYPQTVVTTAQSGGTTTTSASGPQTVIYAESISSPAPFAVLAEAAASAGLFNKSNINVQIIRFAGAPTAIEAVTTGKAQFAFAGSASVINAIQGGATIHAVAGVSDEQPYYIMAKDSITSLTQLKGAKFGISAPGDILTTLTIPFNLYPLNITQQDMTIVSVGSPPARTQALVAGTIDATVLNREAAYQGLPSTIHVVAEVPLPRIAIDWVITNNALIQSNPTLVYNFVKDLVLAARQIQTNQTFYVQVAQKYVGSSWNATGYGQVWKAYSQNYWPVNGGINYFDQDYLNATLQYLVTLHDLKPIGPLSNYIDYSFVAQVIASIGEYPTEIGGPPIG